MAKLLQQRNLYLTDTYRTCVQTTVLDTRSDESLIYLLLADNIFHPQGGGQPDDSGYVNNIEVYPHHHESWPDQVALVMEQNQHAIVPGVEHTVESSVDFEKRKLHAALHTAGHLINAITRQFGDYLHIANNHFPGQARIEYDISEVSVVTEGLAEKIQNHVDDALKSEPIVWTSEIQGHRAVTIDGYGTEYCGGTHVDNLGFLRDVNIRSVKTKKGRLRVGYTANHC